MQVVQKDREIEKSEQIEVEESDAYSLFVYAVRSQITRDYYLRRSRIFLNHIVYVGTELLSLPQDLLCHMHRGCIISSRLILKA
jgi:hypothetical protein